MDTLPHIDPQQETEKITEFIRQTFDSQHFTKAIVAVSGGIDSAITLALTSLALSPENVYSILLPAKQTKQHDLQDAQAAINHAEIPESNQLTIPISSIIQKTWRIINHNTPHQVNSPASSLNRTVENAQLTQANQLRLGNLMARTRMQILYDQAKSLNCLVVGTENRSEHLLGYYTRFGDEASDLEPIRHLYKNQVYELAQHLQIPQSIIDKSPSANLWPGQTDAQELGFTYQQADAVLYLYFDQNIAADNIPKKLSQYDPQLIKNILTVCFQNTFKHQTPYSMEGK